ncbi:EAL domain-containing protein [Jeotgalibacillus proteolyticus]|uniref:EAL domain-containing protein n=1 Tax=Jeotgalibacillus proteolyticus TaxID=2082395 RepID=A0A2S5GH83_9BACL|nr:EAL domain-containing protein [Jeotgalibacillus proteolyticus]PPA72255.1 EAL domain-containing protein [Jeotgalibacillus proteolyticus]
MNELCEYCGISIQIPESGTIKVENMLHKDIHQFNNKLDVTNGVINYTYETLAEVEKLSEWLLSLSTSFSTAKTIISSGNQTISSVSLDKFTEQIRNKEIIDFIQKGELVSYLQPIVGTKTGEVYAYESLLRAKDPAMQISPYELFETARKTGLHSLLDKRAREEAIKAKKRKIKPGTKCFINFLPSTIYNPEFCLKHTFNTVKKYEVAPEDLVFEVVETEKILDVDHLKSVFKTYKREGIKVALDDVGAGFSTIEMLKLLEPDYVKIDRSFVTFCDQDEEKSSFLSEVSHISQNLGIKVLAEGIERKEELEVCSQVGIDLCQGYLFGKPAEKAVEPDCKTIVG